MTFFQGDIEIIIFYYYHHSCQKVALFLQDGLWRYATHNGLTFKTTILNTAKPIPADQ